MWTGAVGDAGRQGAERGWWERHTDAMGPRQALIADLEAGAATIVEYQLTMSPGLLQTSACAEARIDRRPWYVSIPHDSDQVMQAGQRRQ